MSLYKILMSLLVVFTFLDAVVTKIGIGFGCVELNAFVNNLGLESWVIFRFLLLIYLIVIYSVGFRVLRHHSSKSFHVLKNSLYGINIYIGAIVFSGIFHIISRVVL
jgi:hypothetical protein